MGRGDGNYQQVTGVLLNGFSEPFRDEHYSFVLTPLPALREKRLSLVGEYFYALQTGNGI